MILTSPMLLSTTSPTIITLQILLLAHLHAIPSLSLSPLLCFMLGIISTLVIQNANIQFFFVIRKFQSPDVPTTLLKTTPETCAVFVVTKGKLLKSRSASHRHKLSRQQNLSSLLYNSTNSIDSDR